MGEIEQLLIAMTLIIPLLTLIYLIGGHIWEGSLTIALIGIVLPLFILFVAIFAKSWN